MKNVLALLVLLSAPLVSFAAAPELRFEPLAKNVQLLHIGKTDVKRYETKACIVKFKDFLALIELPLSGLGSDMDTLPDHRSDGAWLRDSLRARFPRHKLRYILSSHWHPHSVATFQPLLDDGVRFVTTRSNFEIQSGMLNKEERERYADQFIMVDSSGMTISDDVNRIDVYRLDKSQYKALPTEEFLFFHLPRQEVLYVACMFQRLQGRKIRGHEVVSPRTEDVGSFIRNVNIAPREVLCLYPFWDGERGVITADTLNHLLHNCTLYSSLQNEVYDAVAHRAGAAIRKDADSIITAWLTGEIPLSILNRSTYQLANEGQLPQALELARLQAMILPADPNSWDTLAEMYFYNEQVDLAKYYSAQCHRVDSTFKGGSPEVWKERVEELRKDLGKNQN